MKSLHGLIRMKDVNAVQGFVPDLLIPSLVEHVRIPRVHIAVLKQRFTVEIKLAFALDLSVLGIPSQLSASGKNLLIHSILRRLACCSLRLLLTIVLDNATQIEQ